ncbi:MAG: trans-sulfuration enzyme family protein [Anaerolineae bacterium]
MFTAPKRLLPGGPSTQSVHAGESHEKPFGAVTMPIVQTSTYCFEDTEALRAHMVRKEQGLEPRRGEYGRYGNPLQETVERKLAALEGAEKALVFASGMAAITTTLLTLVHAGDHIILTSDCYRKTRQFALEFLQRLGIDCTLVEPDDTDGLEAAFRPTTRILMTEAPTNPYLRVPDLDTVTEIAHRRHVLAIIDATFATPLNMRPLEHGVDLVIHSATKYLGGHNDLLAGVVAGSEELIHMLREGSNMLGGVPDPQMLYLLLRGLKTLSLRVARHNENGLRLAEFLSSHPAVAQVWYPGLASHPDHAIAKRIMRGFGGVVTFTLDANANGTARFIDALEIPYMGPSLGGVESIVEQPALMSHFALTQKERDAIGIPAELVRYAAGIEDADDLIRDLSQALDAVH